MPQTGQYFLSRREMATEGARGTGDHRAGVGAITASPLWPRCELSLYLPAEEAKAPPTVEITTLALAVKNAELPVVVVVDVVVVVSEVDKLVATEAYVISHGEPVSNHGGGEGRAWGVGEVLPQWGLHCRHRSCSTTPAIRGSA